MMKLVPYLFMLIFLPPVYIVIRYLGWCDKQEHDESTAEDE